jgi:hypothetical protein
MGDHSPAIFNGSLLNVVSRNQLPEQNASEPFFVDSAPSLALTANQQI